MNRKRFQKTLAALVLVTGAMITTPACASSRGVVYVRTGPPRPIVETRIVSPGPRYVWVPGYYQWDGRGYLWRRGQWVLPPRARAVWVPGHWERTHRGWYFVQGRWR